MATQTRRRADTRGQIQRAALHRFTTQGYDATSLREIAEDLGVTKAAVYYHFPTKDDILESLLADLARSLDELITWARSEPSTRERRVELLHRLAVATGGSLGPLMRCAQQNELALASIPAGLEAVKQYKRELWAAATPPDPTVEQVLRARLAIMAVLFANQAADELGGTTDEAMAAALRIADDVLP